MSWDVFVQDLPKESASVGEIPEDFQPGPLGPRSEVIAAISRAVPWADFSEPAWGRIEGDGYSVDINLGEDPVVRSFGLHARGSGRVEAVVKAILAELGVRALDPGSATGIIGPLDDSGWERWTEYRDAVVGGELRPDGST